MTAIHHYEVSLTSIYFRDDNFTVVSLRKRQKLLSVNDVSLNVEKRESE